MMRPNLRSPRAAEQMTRKDSEKDSERPHYYSQFWLDVAAGRKVIGAPKTNEEAEAAEIEIPEPAVLRKPVRPSGTQSFSPDIDGFRDVRPQAEVEPEEVIEPDTDELDLDQEEEIEEPALPSLALDDADIPDVDLTSLEEEAETEEAEAETEEAEAEAEDEDEDLFDEEEDEDEGLDWGARGRKKPKPGRQTKLPPSSKLPPKRGKREPRRGF